MIEAFITDADELARELIEIDENLMRVELTELERGQYLKRRKEIFAAQAGGENLATSLPDGCKAGPQHQKGFAQETADKTGKSKSSYNKSIERVDPALAVHIAPDQPFFG